MTVYLTIHLAGMNLAARFSTSANIGELDLRLTRRSLILGNLALLQVQALIVSLISGLLSFLLGLLSRRGVHHPLQHPVYDHDGVDGSSRGGYFEALLVLCVSMLAASISSGVLGSFMCSLVVLCRRYKVNPGEFCSPRLVPFDADMSSSHRQHRYSPRLGSRRYGHSSDPRPSFQPLRHVHGSVPESFSFSRAAADSQPHHQVPSYQQRSSYFFSAL